MSLRLKLLLPIGVALFCVLIIAGWLVIKDETSQIEQSHREHLATLALTSRSMLHSKAESFMASRGYKFYRFTPGQYDKSTTAGKFAESAFDAFKADSKQETLEQIVKEGGTRTMYIFVPATIEDECSVCHSDKGLNFFADKKKGDMVAVFGVSAPLTKVEETQSSITLATAGGGIVFLVGLSLLMGFIVTRNVSRPLNHVTDRLKDISEGDGDLTKNLQVHSEDEIGQLARHFNSFVEKQRTLIKQIHDDTSVVASASVGLSGIAHDMMTAAKEMSKLAETASLGANQSSENTVSVAASMEQASTNLASVATATEQMSATVADIAAHSDKARNISGQATEQAQTVASMMQQLGQAAREIGKVTETITNISSQTNLLALNATIEAARAGEAGKGFAVVANEIKELARQTASATDDIKARISGVQVSTDNAMADIEKIGGVVQEMGDIVSNIAAAIEEQATVTRDVAGNIAQASTGVRDANERVSETAVASKAVANDVAGIGQSARETQQASERIQARAMELQQLSEKLNNGVMKFKVEDGTRPSQSRSASEPVAADVLIPWRNELSVGVLNMDSQHKQLIGLINSLYAALKRGEGSAATGNILRELVQYTKYHFTAEEKLMEQAHYAGLASQQEAHKKFVSKTMEAQQRWASGDSTVTKEVMDLLMNWLPQHIMKMDKQYTSVLKN